MKRSLLIAIGLLAALLIKADPITKDAAMQKARQFLSTKNVGTVAASRGMRPVELKLSQAEGLDESLYAFNVGQREGFVIVSGDDRTDAVIGYADKGEIDVATMPVNMRNWLQSYADQISFMQQNGVVNEAPAWKAPMAAKTPIAPLLTCEWNQNAPYNDNCPDIGYILNGKYVIERAVTGCVATAAAQVMYWHQLKYGQETGVWQTTTPVIPAYNSYGADIIIWADDSHSSYYRRNYVEAKEPTTIDWSKLQDFYPSDNEESNAEVAKLMEYVGAGLQMNYGPTSFAYFSRVPIMLKNYFGYNKSARYVERNDFTYSDWLALMYDQLKNVGPVTYGGQSTGGGHGFVIDGYDEEDYFHVNWGWGGHSNGYFKLSVLYSDKQGIGGSTSQDGYNYSQNATIDVNPDGSFDDSRTCLTVLSVWTDAATVNRTSRTANFSDVVLHAEIWNRTDARTNFDYGWGLYKDDELVRVLCQYQANLDVNYGWRDNQITLSFGANLEDGTYKIVPISRRINTNTWYPDIYSENNYIKADISSTVLEMEAMGRVNLKGYLSVEDDLEVGRPATVTATVKNDGSYYSADLLLNQYVPDDDNIVLCSQQVELDVEEQKTFTYTFIPGTEGEMLLLLTDRKGNVITDMTVNVGPSTLTTGDLSFDFRTDYTFENGSAHYYDGFYGSTLKGTVKITNSSDVDHTSGIIIRLYEQDPEGNAAFFDAVTSDEIIEHNSSKEIPFEFTGLTPGYSYYINVFYKSTYGFINYSYIFPCKVGVTTYMAGGTLNTVAPTSSVKVDENVLALDISNASTVRSVIPNSNPNTLYIVGNRTPSGLSGKNIIKNGVAEKLTLQDGYGFYAPMSFTAKEATYTRQFAEGVNGANGWSTITLPFNVSEVKQDDNIIDWYHNGSDTDNTDKQFWLKSFDSEDGTTMNFEDADLFEAHTPYLIGMPGAEWGAERDLTGKDITFCAYDALVTATYKSVITGSGYKFWGVMNGEDVTDMYVLNEKGSAFDKTSVMVEPFRAYFKPLKDSAAETDQLQIGLKDIFLFGDVNNDGRVDVSDYIGVANYILQIPQEGFNERAADVNSDGRIDVSDYIGVANIILTGSAFGSGQSATSRGDKKGH